MRAYVPVGWAGLATLHAVGALPPGLRACAVDPAWRYGDPSADEEQWEYEAQQAAADALPEGGGVVLAVDLDPPAGLVMADGWFDLPAPISRADLAAVLTVDLEWFAVQEIPILLEDRGGAG